LIESLFPFIVHRPDMHPTLSPDGVQFVNEHNTRGLRFRLLEQIPYPCGAHAHEHFDEITPAQGEEWHVGFAGDGFGEQRFSCSWRPD